MIKFSTKISLEIWGKRMSKRILIGSLLVLTLLLLMPSIPAIQQKSIEASYKPTIRPFITYNSFIDLNINTSELNSTIPPCNSVVVPVAIEYWTDIPQFFQIIPWRIKNLILFYRFIAPIQEIYFESSDPSDDIDVYFPINPVLTDIPFSGETSEISTLIILVIGENTPSGVYRIRIDASCYNIGRLDGRKYSEAIEFTVGN